MSERYTIMTSDDQGQELYAGNVEWDTMEIVWEKVYPFAGTFTIDEVAKLEKFYENLTIEPVD